VRRVDSVVCSIFWEYIAAGVLDLLVVILYWTVKLFQRFCSSGCGLSGVRC
jgi:hypothetical protein